MVAFGWNYITGQREFTHGRVLINEYERGLLYEKGAFRRLLTAGQYRLWSWQGRRIVIVDMRRSTLPAANQKLLTSDQVTVTLNLNADYELQDPALALHTVVNYHSQLYEDVQMATRTVLSTATLDDLLNARPQLEAQILERVRAVVVAYGIVIHAVGIKDIILAPRVRDLLMKEVETRRLAQASLTAAREEIAALRALQNAARMVAEQPALLRLRELEIIRNLAGSSGHTLVFGGAAGGILPVPEPPANPPVPAPEPTES